MRFQQQQQQFICTSDTYIYIYHCVITSTDKFNSVPVFSHVLKHWYLLDSEPHPRSREVNTWLKWCTYALMWNRSFSVIPMRQVAIANTNIRTPKNMCTLKYAARGWSGSLGNRKLRKPQASWNINRRNSNHHCAQFHNKQTNNNNNNKLLFSNVPVTWSPTLPPSRAWRGHSFTQWEYESQWSPRIPGQKYWVKCPPLGTRCTNQSLLCRISCDSLS